MNGFYIVGRVSGTPERVETSSGLPLCRLRLSVRKTNKDQEEGTEVFEIVLFRSLAEERYEEGQCLAVSGRMSANNFDRDETTYYHTNLIGNSVTVIS
ncbi:MAG: single-stranded DNA-binding protein [Erysipelotrichaceae bacterium]|nr:single-stranded DNA-binding protein [Erysipelotrichaceae bacterium]MBQ6216619.1 single-stranded DNA-binding protein [Erysipelotrichaceae bacterium]MBR6233572.1 single-stranded DNA-binding protein [Erysipelotrichaceae bacterium]